MNIGVDALLGFAIEGDAGGEDPQVQELFLYQTGGGLPSKVGSLCCRNPAQTANVSVEL